MSADFYQLPVYLIGLGVFVTFFLSAIIGYRVRQRQEADQENEAGDVSGLVVGGILALLGLVLAFTYNYNLTRHEARQAAVVTEANTLGTAFLRGDLLPTEQRKAFQVAVLNYAETRFLSLASSDNETVKERIEKSLTAQAVLWPMALEFSAEHLTAAERTFLLGSVNEMLDIHSIRVAVATERMPYIVMIFAFALALIAFYLTGYTSGARSTPPVLLIGTYAMVVAGTFSLIMDFDQSRTGMVQLNTGVLTATVQDMERMIGETQ